jgi:hypothetical protein
MPILCCFLPTRLRDEPQLSIHLQCSVSQYFSHGAVYPPIWQGYTSRTIVHLSIQKAFHADPGPVQDVSMNNLKIVHPYMQSVNSAFISKRCVVPELTSRPCGRHREKLHWVVYAGSLCQVEFRWIPRRSINRPSRRAIKCVAPVPFFVVYPEWIGGR